MKTRNQFILYLIFGYFLSACGDYEVEPQSEGQPSGAVVESDVTEVIEKEFALKLGVYVVNGEGDFVPGLTEQNFRIESIKAGEQDSITFQSTNVASTKTVAKGSYSATLLLDQTKSINGTDPKNRRIQAARIFGEALGDNDYALISSFSANYESPYVRLHTNFTQDTIAINDGLDELRGTPDGGTPLYQAASYMIDYTAENAPGNNKAIILFTDGDDTEEGVTMSELTAYANQRDVRIYTVGLSRQVEVGVLSEIAKKTGGAFLWAEDARQLIGGFGTLGNLLSGDAYFYQTEWLVTQIGSGWVSGTPLVVEVIVTLPQGEEFMVPFEVVVP